MTTAERNNNMVRALDIYSAYPHSDLLPIEPPAQKASAREFLKQVDPRTLGDTLFLFILREVADLDGEREEVIPALNRAIDDLAAVAEAVSEDCYFRRKKGDRQ